MIGLLHCIPWRFILCSTMNSLFTVAILPINPPIKGRVVSGFANRDQAIQRPLTLPFPAPGMLDVQIVSPQLQPSFDVRPENVQLNART